MSHTSKIKNTTFIHNGDYSGNVEIINCNFDIAKVPFSDLKEFIAEYIREQRIRKIEGMTIKQLLK